MARKPKVYAADIDGLHEWIVAAPNQGEALAVLGVNQDLFQQGRARVSDDPKAATAAQAHPGVPLRRLKGSKDAFKPVGDDGAEAWARAAKAAGVRSKPKATPKRDRSALNKAQAQLDAFEKQAAEMLKALEEEAEALARLRDRTVREHDMQRKALRQALEAERRHLEGRG